jgi:hypothetical protein
MDLRDPPIIISTMNPIIRVSNSNLKKFTQSSSPHVQSLIIIHPSIPPIDHRE